SASNDLAAAQQGFDRVKTAYASARSTFGALSVRIKSDLAAYQSAIATAKDQVAIAVSAAGDPALNDVQTQLNAAVTSLTNAAAATATAQDALADVSQAADQLITAANTFDGAAAASVDTASAVSQFQSAQ